MKSSEPALASVYLPASLTSGISPEEQKQANRVQFTFYAKNSFFKVLSLCHIRMYSFIFCFDLSNWLWPIWKGLNLKRILFSCNWPLYISSFLQDASLDNKTLVSTVLGSSVANLSISNLSENIEFTIRNSNPAHVSVMCSTIVVLYCSLMIITLYHCNYKQYSLTKR